MNTIAQAPIAQTARPATIRQPHAAPAAVRAPRLERLSPRAQGIVHTAICRAARLAGWSGKSLLILSAEHPADSPEGQAIAKARTEAEKRALAACSSWHRYALLEAREDMIAIRTPAQLDEVTGGWGGIIYTLDTNTGACSCPDHQGHIQRINKALLTACPDAAPVTCKHWAIAAIMQAQGEIQPNRRQEPTPLAAPSEPAQTEYQKNLAAWNARKHNDPAYLAHKAATEQEQAASDQEEASRTYSTYGDLPGFERLPAKMQRDYSAVLINNELLTLWERDRHITREEARLLRRLYDLAHGCTPAELAEHAEFID